MDFTTRHRIKALVLGLSFEGALAVIAWPLSWLLGLSTFAQIHWSWQDALLGVAAALPMIAIFFSLIRWPMGAIVRIEEFFDAVLVPLFRECTLAELASISLMAGIGEEILFRGVIQAKMEGWLGPWVGLAAASLTFGLMHPISLAYVLLAALCGAYLGCVWMMTDNLLVAIIAHALYDFLALAYLLRRPRLRPEPPADQEAVSI